MPTHHSKMKHNGYGKATKPNPKIPFKLTTEKIPPNNRSVLLIWEKNWGYDIIESYLVHQHVQDDLKLLGKPRITHWLILEKDYS
jgi:hypothetical protein